MKSKYQLGDYTNSNKYGGWFVGSFFEIGHPCQTEKVEVMYKEQPKGMIVKPHYHKEKVELIIMISGKARYLVNQKEQLLETGKYLFVDTENTISGEFLEDSQILAIHAPSIVDDKVEL